MGVLVPPYSGLAMDFRIIGKIAAISAFTVCQQTWKEIKEAKGIEP